MKSNTKGSALLVTIIISAVLLIAVTGILTLSLNEYRGSLKSYLDTAVERNFIINTFTSRYWHSFLN